MRPLHALALALGLAAGCNTPAVPLPPPDLFALSFTTGGQPGFISIVGKPDMRHINVRFYVYDYTSGDGVITRAGADGSFASSPFGGGNGDGVQLYFDTTEGERSQDLCTTLQLDVGLISQRCP